MKQAIFYLEQARVLTEDEEKKDAIGRHLSEIGKLLFKYNSTYLQQEVNVTYKFYVPKRKSPVVDVIKKEANNKRKKYVCLFILKVIIKLYLKRKVFLTGIMI